MTSLRHNDLPPGDAPGDDAFGAGLPAPGSAQDAYLDAARACLLDVGWRRTTLTEVARRAGVSRMTIYRTWGEMPRLLGDLMTREWRGVVTRASVQAELVPAADDPRSDLDRLADGAVAIIGQLRENELFVRIVDLDPELLLPYLLVRRGRSQDSMLTLAERAIRDGQEAGSIRTGDPATIARGIVLAAHGFVLSVHTMVDDDVSEEALVAELREVLVRALRP
ncbi:TetR/AcrR family transcriptional regulator [Nocardioides pacificus]